MSHFIGVCRHCGGQLEQGASLILCEPCAGKALKTLPSSVTERIEIYKILIQTSNNPIYRFAAEQLMNQDIEKLENETLDPTDRMFNPRGE